MAKKMTIPRPEHPQPQFQRDSWINLNGIWTYKFDFGKSGYEQDFHLSKGFDNEILVPFCPESKLSGVEYKDFIEAMWYHRTIEIPKEWQGKRILLHFGGADYETEVFINGKSAGIHYGGSVPFYFDITKLLAYGEKEYHLVVRIKDELRTAGQPRGKQSNKYKSFGCSYTRTTGIWQTVWLEAVDKCGIENVYIIPDIDNSTFNIVFSFFALSSDMKVRATLNKGKTQIASVTSPAFQGLTLQLPVESPILWSPENPFLYDILLETITADGIICDSVKSYAGLRKIHIEGNRIFLNNKPIYLRFVLDQGFYPDGIWTAPTDDALQKDIKLAMKAGFNGARLHQKVFEERFHYWADKYGYLTWAESPSWGCNVNKFEDIYNMINEWRDIVISLRNHPSIIAWTPLNETRDFSNPQMHRRAHIDIYNQTKAIDRTRPVNDASGYIHIKTDLWTVHHYERAEELEKYLAPDTQDGVYHRWPEQESEYEGQPYFNDEFGGLKWISADKKPFADNTWGYGDDIKNEEEFYSILKNEIKVMSRIKKLSGWCYTQLTDVEQEQNGIYNYDRTEKFDMKKIRDILIKR